MHPFQTLYFESGFITVALLKRQPMFPYFEKRGILVPVVVLFPRVFPRDSEDGFLVVFPNQARVLPAVYLLYQPLSQLPVPAAARASVLHIWVHVHVTCRCSRELN